MRSLHPWLRASIAVSLIVAWLAPPAYAGDKPQAYTWSQAQSLKPGTAIMLTVADGARVQVRLWYVAESTLVTSTPTAPPELSQTVWTMLTLMGANWATVIEGREFQNGEVRVSPNGVFEGTDKVAELAEVVQFTARDRVVAIEKPSSPHTRRWGFISVNVALVVTFILSIFEDPD